MEGFGGYGHEFTYSTRGPRRDERPPDVGPNSPWWGSYIDFANHCALLSYLNTDSRDISMISPQPDLRLRHVRKDECECYLLFNEGGTAIDCGASLAVNGQCSWLETSTGREEPLEGNFRIKLAPYEMRVLLVRH